MIYIRNDATFEDGIWGASQIRPMVQEILLRLVPEDPAIAAPNVYDVVCAEHMLRYLNQQLLPYAERYEGDLPQVPIPDNVVKHTLHRVMRSNIQQIRREWLQYKKALGSAVEAARKAGMDAVVTNWAEPVYKPGQPASCDLYIQYVTPEGKINIIKEKLL